MATISETLLGTIGIGGLLLLLVLALSWVLLPWLLLARLSAIRDEIAQSRRETVAKLAGVQQQLAQTLQRIP